MDTKLRRDVRLLKSYLLFVTLACIASITVAFASQGEKHRFQEIDVERINVVESDGQLRMVLSNAARQHPGQVDGKLLPRRQGRPPGLLFFDHVGDECGGLVFDECDGKGHFVSLTMDKSRQDQTIVIQHLESDNGQYFAGLSIWDRPNSSLADLMTELEEIEELPSAEKSAALAELRARGELGRERIMVGKGRDQTAEIRISDAEGRPRIRISVAPSGHPVMEFLDEAGRVVHSVPEPREPGAK